MWRDIIYRNSLMAHYGGVIFMQKNQNKYWNVTTIVYMALLVALNLVMSRILVIDIAGVYRIALGPVAIIMAGLWLGPVCGGVCGMTADIIGCFMKGYAVNPLITLAAVLWGVIPALIRPKMAGWAKKGKVIGISVSVAICAVLSSLVVTTAGLVWLLGYNFYAIFPGRVVQFLIMTPIYCVLSNLLYFSPLTNLVLNGAVPRTRRA